MVLSAVGSTNTHTGLNAEDLNNFFAASSSDPGYIKPMRKTTANHELCTVSESILFKVRDGLHHTAEGADGLPALIVPPSGGLWLLRNLSAPHQHVARRRLCPYAMEDSGHPPEGQGYCPKTPADYRHISVLPILS